MISPEKFATAGDVTPAAETRIVRCPVERSTMMVEW